MGREGGNRLNCRADRVRMGRNGLNWEAARRREALK